MTIHENFIQELKKWLSDKEIADFVVACQKPLKKSLTLNTYKVPTETFMEMTKNR